MLYRFTLLSALTLVSVSASGDREDAMREGLTSSCDVYDGEWVPASPEYPASHSCIPSRFNCQGKAKMRGKSTPWSYRWKPRECELPEFSPKAFLSCMRNRRLKFIGDSIAGNWMHSLRCLLSDEKSEGDANMHFPDFNFTVDNVRSNHLVHKTTTLVKKKMGRSKEVSRGRSLPTVGMSQTIFAGIRSPAILTAASTHGMRPVCCIAFVVLDHSPP